MILKGSNFIAATVIPFLRNVIMARVVQCVNGPSLFKFSLKMENSLYRFSHILITNSLLMEVFKFCVLIFAKYFDF